jgi:hypothetical protein
LGSSDLKLPEAVNKFLSPTFLNWGHHTKRVIRAAVSARLLSRFDSVEEVLKRLIHAKKRHLRAACVQLGKPFIFFAGCGQNLLLIVD